MSHTKTRPRHRQLHLASRNIKDSDRTNVLTLIWLLYSADDPSKVVKVIASNGKTGEQCDLSYTGCKVVGNGSFGVVFQAKLVPGSLGEDRDDDVAIKKVLQDKRFKVRSESPPAPTSAKDRHG